MKQQASTLEILLSILVSKQENLQREKRQIPVKEFFVIALHHFHHHLHWWSLKLKLHVVQKQKNGNFRRTEYHGAIPIGLLNIPFLWKY
uniref:Uncharacterized protein n=2 Tax=Amphimedon queenslandica TaxID=400682 RepID=A0A1X7TP82_AMPQE